MDLNALGTAIAGTVSTIGLLAGGAYAWWLKQQKNAAEVKADVAGSNADRAVADAQQTVYKLLTDRLTKLEAEVSDQRKELNACRVELDAERRHSRALEIHVRKLEAMMRSAGITPPPFIDPDAPAGAPGA